MSKDTDMQDNIPQWDAVDVEHEEEQEEGYLEENHDEEDDEAVSEKPKSSLTDSKLFLPAAIAGVLMIAGAGTFVMGGFGRPNVSHQSFSIPQAPKPQINQQVTPPVAQMQSPSMSPSIRVDAPSVPAPVAIAQPVMAGTASKPAEPVQAFHPEPSPPPAAGAIATTQSETVATTPITGQTVTQVAPETSSQDARRLSDLEASNQAMAKNIAALTDEITQMRQMIVQKNHSEAKEGIAHRQSHKVEVRHEVKKSTRSVVSGWHLSAVTEGSVAILNDSDGSDHVVHEGDTLDGFTVEKIGGDFVKTNHGLIR